MGDKTAVLVAAGITVPLVFLLIYVGLRNLFANLRNVKDTIETEVARRRQLDARRLRESEAMVSSAAISRNEGAKPLQSVLESPRPDSSNQLDQTIGSKVAGSPPRPVVLARMPRERGRDWSQDRSWFGGLPRLGGAPWPRGSNGSPLPFAAQIDLAEVAAACPESLLPHKGSLAFFLNEGAVIYVPEGDHAQATPPDELPPAYDEGGYPLPERTSRTSRPLFPFWPVELIGLPLAEDLRAFADEERHEKIWDAQNNLLKERVRGRQYAFSVSSARKEGVASADKLWWYGALHVQDKLRDALDGVERSVDLRQQWIDQAREYQARLAAEDTNEEKIAKSRADEERHKAQIPEIRRQGAELQAFIAQNESVTTGRDPWDEMSPEDISALQEVMKEAREKFPDLCTFGVPMRIDDVRNLCVRRMISGEPDALVALPDDLLAFVNENYRLTTQSPHQIFGLAGVQQSNLYDHLDDLLLLQIGYDDMNEWCFGDTGLWHFWISPANAAAGRWDEATLTFECG